MEVIDESGDFIAWLSNDPDDWNSFSDYERKIKRMVLEYNEVAFCFGEHLLGYDSYQALELCELSSASGTQKQTTGHSYSC